MRKFITFVAIVLSISGCKKNNIIQPVYYDLHGQIQKGPFLTGTNITIYELTNNLIQNGKSYNATVMDDKGTFNISGVNLTSEFILIKATGSYYHELLNGIDGYPCTLYAITDIDSSSCKNVNLMTHIEKERIENLVKTGLSPHIAMEQANNELLKVFNLENHHIQLANKIDLTVKSDGSEILMALTSIVVGELASMQLMEFLTKFRSDFGDDGKISDASIQKTLMSNALFSAPDTVFQFLKARYYSLGASIANLSAKRYIEEFISKSTFPSYFDSLFPKTTINGENLITKVGSDFLDVNKLYYIIINAKDPTIKSFSLYLSKTSNSGTISTPGAFWHNNKNGTFSLLGIEAVDNKILLSGSGELTLKFFINNGQYSSIFVNRKYRW